MRRNKQICFICLLLLYFGSCTNEKSEKQWSNDGTFTIGTLIENNGNDEPLVYTFQFEPANEEVIDLSWSVLHQEIPNIWEIFFCDNKGCHFEWSDTMSLHSIVSTDKEKAKQLSLYLTKNGTEGQGKISLLILNKNFNTSDTLCIDLQ